MKVTFGTYPDNLGHIDVDRVFPLPRRQPHGERRHDDQRRVRVLPQADRAASVDSGDVGTGVTGSSAS